MRGYKLQNGSDHKVVASYSGEGEVELINVFGLVF